MAHDGDITAEVFARADLAPPDLQDRAADWLLRQFEADPKLQGDPERIIAAWFAGQGPQAYGPKEFWGSAPTDASGGTTAQYNPAIREYVDSVLAHIADLRRSA